MVRTTALLCLATLLLTACGVTRAPVVEEQPVSSGRARLASPPLGYYQIKRGDTLYSIAFQYGYAYQEIAAWNHIVAPYVIYIGQHLRVMPPGAAAAPSQIRILPAEPQPAPQTNVGTASGRTPSSPTMPFVEPLPSGPLQWFWPAQGVVLHSFNADEPGRKGIDIRGRRGQEVTAAAKGWVVYSGSGLIGYGQLIIVKHDKNFLSAYAYNESILVKEGDIVRAGQRIAIMGMHGTDGPMLHFEVRHDGKPENPLRYLPQR